MVVKYYTLFSALKVLLERSTQCYEAT